MKKALLLFIGIIAVTIGLSFLFTSLTEVKKEAASEQREWVIESAMTLEAFGQANNLPNPLLKEIFTLTAKQDLQKTIASLGLTDKEVIQKIKQATALEGERVTKNWMKIRIKFAGWLIFITVMATRLRKGRITAKNRIWLYALSVLVFGIILGSDPSPMGTVKDAVVLYGSEGVIFRPRMIAFIVFTVLVILANKSICAWGCQLGVLQDLIFRLGRDKQDQTGVLPQIKLPFALTNTLRVLFFIALTAGAFLWAMDLVHPIDPFRVFNPATITLAGGLFLLILLTTSLFIYRPGCHLFCPFGLTGWLAEKISLLNIRVDYDKCIGCEACSKACPSNVMDAILKQDRVRPDCFSCGTCIEVCPVGAVRFGAGKRQKVPAGKFAKPEKETGGKK
ncbi:MAG: 4Fe-4S binding protein [Kiritimatiellales bacterium]|nr:4Fe-4S binding protein [Kiritimatiellales bacterium]